MKKIILIQLQRIEVAIFSINANFARKFKEGWIV